ncbi:hypothetical protein L3Y34_007230 [Caenorhabditis briggsae]|uniref:Uncharacterized protein n=1 Tax=Caenorhabditis briggsae TaxID=6238 RepID=A0AAE8ZW99_CAEBR|nr:hypothetical protein L3Y34_007230 [Caenorhabditis briggsae]
MLRIGGGVTDDGLEDSFSLFFYVDNVVIMTVMVLGSRRRPGEIVRDAEKMRTRVVAMLPKKDVDTMGLTPHQLPHHNAKIDVARRGEEGVEKKKSSTTSSWWRSFDTQTVRWMAPRGNASLLRL